MGGGGRWCTLEGSLRYGGGVREEMGNPLGSRAGAMSIYDDDLLWHFHPETFCDGRAGLVAIRAGFGSTHITAPRPLPWLDSLDQGGGGAQHRAFSML